MNESTVHSTPKSIEVPTSTPPEVPTEIISDEKVVTAEAAFSSASCTVSPPISLTQFHGSKGTRSIESISLFSKKRFSSTSGNESVLVGDIEDSAPDRFCQRKKSKANESLFHRFRRSRGLSVTDLTGTVKNIKSLIFYKTEWCEKHMEFVLFRGRPKPTKAMQAGSSRHAALEEEVIKRVNIAATTAEDRWALKFVNFIIGADQLLTKGLTRELPLVSFEKGVWMVGIVDEIRIPLTEIKRYATLVDTKTRAIPKPPAKSQQRTGRLQLMCYKRLWDNLVTSNFPSGKFFDFFTLNPSYVLPSEIKEQMAKSSAVVETLNDLVILYQNTCCLLPPAHDELLLRYEYQNDQSLIGEDRFAYDDDWLDSKLKSCLEFWLGEREPSYAPEEERWKCRFCTYSSTCPINSDPGLLTSPSLSTEE